VSICRLIDAGVSAAELFAIPHAVSGRSKFRVYCITASIWLGNW
jgi:hypothetical protein